MASAIPTSFYFGRYMEKSLIKESFNPFAPNFIYQQSYLVEASAGTGKTFTVEQLFLRHFLEDFSLKPKSCVCVTFTNAAVEEMRMRLCRVVADFYEKLEKKGEAACIGYQKDLFQRYGKEKLLLRLVEIEKEMEKVSISTIHAFCRTLLALSAELYFQESSEPSFTTNRYLLQKAASFLKKGRSFSKKEAQLLLKKAKYNLVDLEKSIIGGLSAAEKVNFLNPPEQALEKWADFLRKNFSSKEHLSSFLLDNAQDFKKNSSFFKITSLEEEIDILSDSFNEKDLQKWWVQNALGLVSLPAFFALSNKKIKVSQKPLLDEISENLSFLGSFIKENRATVIERVAAEFLEEKFILEEKRGEISLSQLLKKTAEIVRNPLFKMEIQKQFSLVFIDEFQDTDPLQWEIFSNLFLENSWKGSLYFVGDPKQAIYSFRGADIRAYLEAKKRIPVKNHLSLKKNYRSSSKMVRAFNALFSEEYFSGIFRETEDQEIFYEELESGFSDGDDCLDIPVYFVQIVEEENFKENSASFITDKLFILKNKGIPLDKVALLVKDRYQAAFYTSFLENAGILCANFTKQEESGEEIIFLKTLLKVIQEPEKKNIYAFLMHPFFGLLEQDVINYEKKERAFFLSLSSRYRENFAKEKSSGVLFSLILDLLKKPFLWQEGFRRWKKSFFLLKSLLKEISNQEISSIQDIFVFLRWYAHPAIEKGKIPFSTKENHVSILTVHSSKGLEFEYVFYLESLVGQREEEENPAERMRLFYVGLTRAKKFLYIFSPPEKKKKNSSWEIWENFLLKNDYSLDIFKKFPELFSFSTDTSNFLKSNLPKEVLIEKNPPKLELFLEEWYSYTKLSLNKSSLEMVQNFFTEDPYGKEVGTLWHELIKQIFSKRIDKEQFIIWFKQLHGIPLAEREWFEKTLLRALTNKRAFLDGASLNDLFKYNVNFWCEVPFSMSIDGRWMRGALDLIFYFNNRFFLIDWKTHELEAYGFSYKEEDEARFTEGQGFFSQLEIYEKAFIKYIRPFIKTDKINIEKKIIYIREPERSC